MKDLDVIKSGVVTYKEIASRFDNLLGALDNLDRIDQEMLESSTYRQLAVEEVLKTYRILLR